MERSSSNTLDAIAFLTIILFSCGTENEEPWENNEIIAEIIQVSPNPTINFKAIGSDVKMGCDIYQIGTGISGTDTEHNIALSFGINPCANSKGNYSILRGSYERPRNNLLFNSDMTFNSKHGGSITITKFDDNYWEGVFEAILYCPGPSFDHCDEKDSIIVRGTFKGYRF